MSYPYRAPVLCLSVVAGLVLLSYCAVKVDLISGRIDAALTVCHSMQTLTSSWLSGGVTHTVTTPYESPETAQEHLNRHDEAVKVALQRYPVDD